MSINNQSSLNQYLPWCLRFLACGIVSSAAIAPLACGRSDSAAKCVAFRYRVNPGTIPAVFDPGGDDPQIHTFSSPSIIVDIGTHQSIQTVPLGDAAQRLRSILADATRERCRRTLEQETPGFDFRADPSNCDEYTPESVEYAFGTVEASDFDDSPGPPVELNPVCFARCLLDECNPGDTGGSYDPIPEFSSARTVRCKCEIEEVGECPSPPGSPEQVSAQTTHEEDFCVPTDRNDPAEYCRVDVADYLAASIRTINYYGGVHVGGFDDSCGSFTPAALNVQVECRPVDAYGNVQDESTFAYTEQNDTCNPGCASLSCNDTQNDGIRECTVEGESGCPASCTLDSACDCDLLPAACFEGEPIPGVCLPDAIGGADGGSGDGGGPSERLRSAITLLAGPWLMVADEFSCSQLEPSGSLIPPSGNPAPSSTVSPYALANGTSFTEGLLHTCPDPAVDPVGLSTFGPTLEELCRQVPLCNASNELLLTLTASESSSPLASGSLTKTGDSISTEDASAPLAAGDHLVDLCLDHPASGVEACSQQPIRASEPLGTGVDEFGYFAGELAPDFVKLAEVSEATALTLSDDGVLRVSLPSGFEFPFYGATISDSLWIGANGGIDTTAGSIDAANTSLLDPGDPWDPPDLAVYWDDLDPGAGGGVFTWFDGERFIVSWEDVPHGRDEESPTVDGISVQAHIHRSGLVEFHYADIDVGDERYDRGKSATIGLVDPLGLGVVELSVDDSTLWSSGLGAVGIAHADDGCLASELIIPPEVGCTAADHFATVCTPTGDGVVLPLPEVSACADGAVGLIGTVTDSGSTEATLAPLDAPLAVGPGGAVVLDEGVHRIEWRPIDELGVPVGPAFFQLAFIQPWVHETCGAAERSLIVLTDDDDTHVGGPQPDALALIGLVGDDVLVAGAGNDFLGDGAGAGICEAYGGSDRLVGEGGDDTLDGGPGDDLAWGGPGHDLLVGGLGLDHLEGGTGNDIIHGDDGDDELWGGLGDDVLEGGDGADTLIPGGGLDAAYGGPGDDTLVLLGSCELTPGTLLSGGSGTDTLKLPPGLTLSDVVAAGVTVEPDIETVEASADLPVHRMTCEPS